MIALPVRIAAPVAAVDDVAAAVQRVGAALGLPLEPQVTCVIAETLRIAIGDQPLKFSRDTEVRARMAVRGRMLAPGELGEPVDAALLAAIVEGALIARPEALAAPVSAALGIGELALLLPAVLACGVSIGSPDALLDAFHALPLGRPGERREHLISHFHPRTVTVELARAELVELLRRDPHADAAPLATLHERAYSELGVIAPLALQLADLPRGCYRVRVNHLAELPQPLIPADRALVAAEAELPAVHVPAWCADAALGPTAPDATTALDYLALEVFAAISRRAPRLVERAELDRRLAALRKPAVVALAAAGPHLAELPRALRALLAEGVAIRDLGRIVEHLIDFHEVEAPPPRAHIVLTRGLPVSEGLPAAGDRLVESLRRVLGGAIRAHAARDTELAVLLVSPAVERTLLGDPPAAWSDELVAAITRAAPAADGVLVTIEIRARLRALLADALPDLPVLSFQELQLDSAVTSIATVDLAPPSAEPIAPTPRALTVRDPDDGFAVWLADAVTQLPALPRAIDDEAAPPPPADILRRARAFAADPGRAPDSLADQGWGVIIPVGPRGDALLAAIQPLVDHRTQIQQAMFRLYRVSPRLDAAESAAWLREIFESDPAHRRPRYLLILGDLSEVSLELQLALAPYGGVGRLAFTDLADYTRYAHKAIAADARSRDQLRSELYLADDHSRANAIARGQLVEPCAAQLDALTRDRRYRVTAGPILGGGKATLLDRARDADFLFTVSHGVGSAMSYEDRQRLQGALLTAPGELLTGRDVAERPFVRHGVWLMFACYGLGTPARSSYAGWIDDLYRTDRLRERDRAVIEAGQLAASEAPFIADLPRRALANPDGPLAVIGHIDLAWSYSFTAEGQSRFDRLYATVQLVLQAQLAGFAFEQLTRNCVIASDQLAQLYLQRSEHARGMAPAVEPRLLARTWMLRQDLRGFILLGDPAARLKLS